MSLKSHYTLQVSMHPDAGARIPTVAAAESWRTVYDGPIATPAEARAAVEKLAEFYTHARAFKGKELGKIFYSVLRGTRS